MNRTTPLPPRRRLASALFVAVGLAFGPGCEEADETIRGAGSIDVPVHELGFRPSDVPAPTPPPEDSYPGPDLEPEDEAIGTGRN